MKRGSEWLSQGAECLAAQEDAAPTEPPAYDVLIVGSGYGGAVAAARVAEWATSTGRPLSIAVLERGLEYLPGDFPKTLDELTAHVRISGGKAGIRGWPDGLFDVRLGDDVSALVSNGLGGGSLINAGVAEEADPASRADAAWPSPWYGNDSQWDTLYRRARTGLAVRDWKPAGAPKEVAMRRLGRRLGAAAGARPVALTIQPPDEDDANASPPLKGCAQCGDCFSGCNVGAKRTLGTTYLKRARDLGVALYTGATVLRLQRDKGPRPWVVHWVFSDPKRVPMRESPYRIVAGRVILAAGTFGSTEILLRSQSPGLRFSSQLGAGFSTNGDVIGAQYGLRETVNPWAREEQPRDQRKVGPTITHKVELERDNRKTPARRLVVQDLTVPAPLGWLFGELLTSLMLPQRWTRFDLRPRGPRSADPATLDDAPGSALTRTLLLSAFGHDGAAGRLHTLPGFDKARHDGNLVVHWPRAGAAACFRHADRRLLAATSVGAYWLRNPLWQAVPNSPLIDQPKTRQVFTVHPLGGCRMAHSMKDGVVDPFGRVFDAGTLDDGGPAGRRGAEWVAREDRRIHDGLYVLDGSIVPTSLGINPLLTITALAEGILDEWLVDWGHARPPAGSVQAPQPQPLPPWLVTFPTPEAWPVGAGQNGTAPATTSLEFKERMVGLLEPGRQPADAADEHFRLSIRFNFDPVTDVHAFVREPGKRLGFEARIQLVCSSWDAVKGRQVDRSADPPAESAVRGSVQWFTPRPTGVLSRIWRTFRGWWQLRRAADLYNVDRDGTRIRSILLRPADWADFARRVWAFLKILTQFGAPRLLKYRLDGLHQPLSMTTRCGRTFTLPVGTAFSGAKSLVYEAGGNPWVQLTEMPLRFTLPGERVAAPLATLRYDELFMLGRDQLPLMLTRQHDGVTGLRDALSLLLYAGRVIFLQHFLSFRKPDYALRRPLRRLPWQDKATRYPQLEFCVFDDVFVQQPMAGGGAIRLRLTRIRKRNAPVGDPVLLLHGFGSGGIQFTHEAIPEPMAQWLAEQGREVWVGELRTSIGLSTCDQQWVMDDIAQEDIPALVNAIQRERGNNGPIDIVAHCIGSAMFCMAALAGKLDGKIRRAVLMQVGPIVHLPRGNRMRGYLGNRGQKLFGLGLVQSTVSDEASDAEVALDRVLATFPYLGEFDPAHWRERLRENCPAPALSSDLRHNGRLVNAMRSAGVFAQLFRWPNLFAEDKPLDNQPLLDALPDLLGPCNLTTYQQTVQYAFLRRLTSQDGNNAYVTDDNVRRYLDFPILFVQGALNDVFAPRGTYESRRLIKRVFGDQHLVERIEVLKFGHLDCVVGLTARQEVFEKMLPFLQCDPKPEGSSQDEADFRAPSIGPWLGDAQWRGDVLGLRVGLKVDEQGTPPSHIYSVLVAGDEAEPRPLAATLKAHATLIAGAGGSPPVAAVASMDALAFWPEGEAVLQIDIPSDLHRCEKGFGVWLCTAVGHPPGTSLSGDEFVAAWATRRAGRAKRAPRSEVELPIDSLHLDAAWLAASRAAGDDIAFALVSCRQAPLLVDRHIADATFKDIEARLAGLNHVLMVGDQIYADALAASGGADGTRLRFFDAHREAWTADHQREVMRRRPVYMAADDHEFRDDHNNAVRRRHRREWLAARDAMWRYQYAAGPRGVAGALRHNGKYGYSMQTAGFDTFVCDTRNRRLEQSEVHSTTRRIMLDEQFTAIERWLAQSKQTGRARFLVVPTPVAPVFRTAVSRPEYGLRCDDWQRYPESLAKLFALLVADGAERLVLLSGDYHCFVDCELEIFGNGAVSGEPVRCRSIVTSGAHSPYGFANTDEEELWQPSGSGVKLTCGPYRWSYHIHRFAAGRGYTLIEAHGATLADPIFVKLP